MCTVLRLLRERLGPHFHPAISLARKASPCGGDSTIRCLSHMAEWPELGLRGMLQTQEASPSIGKLLRDLLLPWVQTKTQRWVGSLKVTTIWEKSLGFRITASTLKAEKPISGPESCSQVPSWGYHLSDIQGWCWAAGNGLSYLRGDFPSEARQPSLVGRDTAQKGWAPARGQSCYNGGLQPPNASSGCCHQAQAHTLALAEDGWGQEPRIGRFCHVNWGGIFGLLQNGSLSIWRALLSWPPCFSLLSHAQSPSTA